MGERAPYSRVYWSIVDDPKFATIFDDDHHLSTWLRLLIAADAIWPASPSLPVSARKASVKALSAAGILDLQGTTRYRVHGLDNERTRRKEAATSRGPNGDHSDTERSPNGPSRAGDAILVSSLLGDARLDEGGPGGPDAGSDPVVALYDRTGRFPAGKIREWVVDLGNRHGNSRVADLIRLTPMQGTDARAYLTAITDQLRAEDHVAEAREAALEAAKLAARRTAPTPLRLAPDPDPETYARDMAAAEAAGL